MTYNQIQDIRHLLIQGNLKLDHENKNKVFHFFLLKPPQEVVEKKYILANFKLKLNSLHITYQI